MDKEEPNTQLFYDNKIARVVFELDNIEGVAHWINVDGLTSNDIHYYYYRLDHRIIIGVDEWISNNNILLYPNEWNEDLWTEFKLRFL